MKKILRAGIISVLLLAIVQITGCSGKNQEEAMAQPKTVKLALSGMHCEGCVNTIQKSLAKTEGVISNSVSLEDSIAVVSFDPAKADEQKLILAVENAGYKARLAQ